jgi:hypothetical protein
MITARRAAGPPGPYPNGFAHLDRILQALLGTDNSATVRPRGYLVQRVNREPYAVGRRVAHDEEYLLVPSNEGW